MAFRAQRRPAHSDMYTFNRTTLIEFVRVVAEQSAASIARPIGVPPAESDTEEESLIYVLGLDDLLDALERAEAKGYLPDVIQEHYHNFSYRYAAPLSQQAQPVATAQAISNSADFDRIKLMQMVPLGWKIVPIEPTREMFLAGALHTMREDVDTEAEGEFNNEFYRARGQAIAVYMDMLAVAPITLQSLEDRKSVV